MGINYGMPAVIQELEQIDKEYEEFHGLATLGFYIALDYCRYMITPADLVPFACTGGDGIHFGFLTDYGKTTDLSKAPIVCVSPMDDPPLNVVARDIYNFLAIVCKVRDAEKLEYVDFSIPENEWLDEIVNVWLDSDEHLKAANLLSSAIMDRFTLEEPASVYASIEAVRAERKREICIETLDGLGIVGTLEAGKEPRRYDFNGDGAKDLAKIGAFVKTASHLEKLALCRDAQYSCIFSRRYDGEIQIFMADMLQSMGLMIEAENLRSM
ncbi:MAG: hypothetical protein HYV27_05205 [Candidatus Hydrogenedentes bacterium]|nr:hypothetical protein [Candidatus Hydrogenedentota bacterium]